MGLRKILVQQWFIFCLVIVIFLAYVNPEFGLKGGPLKPEYTKKYGAVMLIFTISGLTQKGEEIKKAVSNLKVHTFVQTYSFLFYPLFMNAIFMLLKVSFIDIKEGLEKGFIALSCLPPPVSSAMILTQSAGADEAVSLFNSALGSILGVFVTPIQLLLNFGQSGNIPLGSIVAQIFSVVLFPLCVGQCLRKIFGDRLFQLGIPFSKISSFTLLYIIYISFCSSFSNPNLEISQYTLIGVVLIVILLNCLSIFTIFCLALRLRIYKDNEIGAMIFCASHKSLTLGVPLFNILFDTDPDLSYITIPLLVWHPTQIIIGSILAPYIQDWIENKRGVVQVISSRIVNRKDGNGLINLNNAIIT